MAAPDKRSFVAAVAERYGQRLRHFLAVRSHNSQEVPDLAQEVFLRLLRTAGHDSIRNPEAYLFTIASHVVHQHAVRHSKAAIAVDIDAVFAELAVPSGEEPLQQAEQAQRMKELQQILQELPVRVAAALVLHRIEGYTVEEIGNELGVARETAKKYLARALEHCRTRWVQER